MRVGASGSRVWTERWTFVDEKEDGNLLVRPPHGPMLPGQNRVYKKKGRGTV